MCQTYFLFSRSTVFIKNPLYMSKSSPEQCVLESNFTSGIRGTSKYLGIVGGMAYYRDANLNFSSFNISQRKTNKVNKINIFMRKDNCKYKF